MLITILLALSVIIIARMYYRVSVGSDLRLRWIDMVYEYRKNLINKNLWEEIDSIQPEDLYDAIKSQEKLMSFFCTITTLDDPRIVVNQESYQKIMDFHTNKEQ